MPGLYVRRRYVVQDLSRPEIGKKPGSDRQGQVSEVVRGKHRRSRKPSGASMASGSTGSSLIPRSRTPRSRARSPIKWFEDGLTNVSYNCIDRHLKTHGEQVAIIWEGDNPYIDKKITYNELYDHVCRLANVLKKHGVKKGDRVTIYMPMIPEAAYAMLACCPHRRHPFGGLRRLFAGSAGRPHRRLRIDLRHHLR